MYFFSKYLSVIKDIYLSLLELSRCKDVFSVRNYFKSFKLKGSYWSERKDHRSLGVKEESQEAANWDGEPGVRAHQRILSISVSLLAGFLLQTDSVQMA